QPQGKDAPSRRGCIISTFVVLVLTGSCLTWGWWMFYGGWSKEAVEQLLKEQIKPGMQRAEVEEWLRSQGFREGHYEPTPKAKKNLEAILPDGKATSIKGTLSVTISGRYWSIGSQELIFVQFRFDDEDRLMDYTISRHFGSL